MKRNGKPASEPKPVPRYWEKELDWAYSETVYPQLARKYPNEWVAFRHQRVLAHGKELMTVLNQARRKVREREIPHLFVEYGFRLYTHVARLDSLEAAAVARTVEGEFYDEN